MRYRRYCLGLFLTVVVALGVAWAAPDPAQVAETLRSSLTQAQLDMVFDHGAAQQDLDKAEQAWQTLAPTLPGIQSTVEAAFVTLGQALETGDEAAFAAARSTLWTAILNGSYQELTDAVSHGDATTAQQFLTLREYRHATRYSAPGADATLAVTALASGEMSVADALAAVKSDLLDAYQSRLNDALRDLKGAIQAGYKTRQAELAALARGYFNILAPTYAQIRGQTALAAAQAAFATGSPATISAVLEGFRAAPLSPQERAKRASQTLKFLSLVPIEYARGASGPEGNVRIINDLEITEASTFFSSASSSFADLEPLLYQRDSQGMAAVKASFNTLEQGITAANAKQNIPTAAWIKGATDDLVKQLDALVPAAWRKANAASDVDVINQQLKAMQNAVASGNYAAAERARLDAYAMLESGPEARLNVFMPQLTLDLENLFWYGTAPKGLARLIRDHASLSEVKQTQAALADKLEEASHYLSAAVAPAAITTDAAIIVFREGLESVLILAALLGSLKRPEVRRYRKPLWWGSGLALVGTVITWFVMRGLLTQFARYGEKLEAIVGIIAVAVLLVIMNWFFHQVYWVDHLAGFHKRKQSLLGSSQQLGLVLLGLSAIYREGFEVVLFLQSLVLQSSLSSVLLGIAIGLAATVAVGSIVFMAQAKLPFKKMLIATGGMICFVLAIMVGNTVHVLQLVGWFPVHPLPITLPSALGLWLGTYATYEGLILQVVAVAAVTGSYFAAEGIKKRKRKSMTTVNRAV